VPEIDLFESFSTIAMRGSLRATDRTSTQPQGGGRPVAARRGDGFA